ncbi:MAG: glycosyltransferase [Planctomycetota bacterium]
MPPRRRILAVTPFLPSRASRHGGGQLCHALLHALAEQAEVHLCALATSAELDHVADLSPALASTRVVVRRAKSTHGSFAWKRTMLRRYVRGLNVTTAKYGSGTMRRVVESAIARIEPDAVLAELLLAGRFLPRQTNALRVVTDHEAATYVPARVLPLGLGIDRDRRLWRNIVQSVTARAEVLQALNSADAETLSELTGREVIVRHPALELPAEPVKAPDGDLAVGFLGDHSHGPNPEASRFLATEVLPRLRKLEPSALLRIAGPGSQEALAELSDSEGLELLGPIPDTASFFAGVHSLAAPLFSGLGTRMKVLDSLRHGVPVVSNNLGLRGIDAGEPAVFSSQDADEIASNCVRLFRDQELGSRARTAAREHAEAHLDPSRVAAAQLQTIEIALESRD